MSIESVNAWGKARYPQGTDVPISFKVNLPSLVLLHNWIFTAMIRSKMNMESVKS